MVSNKIIKGAYPNPQDSYGNTPAHLAAQKGHGYTLSLLLTGGPSGGADLEIVNAKGQTVADVATNDCTQVLTRYLASKVKVPLGKSAQVQANTTLPKKVKSSRDVGI
jgi:ankyrin repeat protein